jgi:DNA ligase-associated metallophosphoesterase
VDCCGEALSLLPDKLVYWAAKKTLFAADVHAGKEQAFNRAGVPIPAGISEDTFSLLMGAVDQTGAERLVILGDLLHTVPDLSETWQVHWQSMLAAREQLCTQVIIGNHDSLAARRRLLASVEWTTELLDPPFVCLHQPCEDMRGFVLAGHIHPVWQLSVGKRQRITAPVFWFQQQLAVLPAFGLFTGGYRIERKKTDRLYMVGEGCVIEV